MVALGHSPCPALEAIDAPARPSSRDGGRALFDGFPARPAPRIVRPPARRRPASRRSIGRSHARASRPGRAPRRPVLRVSPGAEALAPAGRRNHPPAGWSVPGRERPSVEGIAKTTRPSGTNCEEKRPGWNSGTRRGVENPRFLVGDARGPSIAAGSLSPAFHSRHFCSAGDSLARRGDPPAGDGEMPARGRRSSRAPRRLLPRRPGAPGARRPGPGGCRSRPGATAPAGDAPAGRYGSRPARLRRR